MHFDCPPVTHCEFEYASAKCNRPIFSKLKTLVCHRILEADNLTVLPELISDLPDLTEVHCHLDGLTSLTDACSYSNLSGRMNAVRSKMAPALDNKSDLQIYIQSIPLQHFPSASNSSVLALQLALFASKAVSERDRITRFPWVVQIDFLQLLDAVPYQITDLYFHKMLSHKFPNLQEVKVDGQFADQPVTSTLIVPFFQALRSVRKLIFHHSGFEPAFFSGVLSFLPCLVGSLVWLEINEPLHWPYATTNLTFLRYFRNLRFFGTNLICRELVPSMINLVAQFPITFQLRFGTDESTNSTAIIRKVAKKQFELAIRQHHLGSESTLDLGSSSLAELKIKLDKHPRCGQMLPHEFDDIGGEITGYYWRLQLQAIAPLKGVPLSEIHQSLGRDWGEPVRPPQVPPNKPVPKRRKRESHTVVETSRSPVNLLSTNCPLTPPQTPERSKAHSDVQMLDVQMPDVQMLDVQAPDVQASDVQASQPSRLDQQTKARLSVRRDLTSEFDAL